MQALIGKIVEKRHYLVITYKMLWTSEMDKSLDYEDSLSSLVYIVSHRLLITKESLVVATVECNRLSS